MESAAEVGAVINGDTVRDSVVGGVAPADEIAAVFDDDRGARIRSSSVAAAEGEEEVGWVGGVIESRSYSRIVATI